jgi:GTPase SAR1 family protein
MVEFSESAIQEIRLMPHEIIDPKFSQSDFLFKLIIVGDSAVGKSCLM